MRCLSLTDFSISQKFKLLKLNFLGFLKSVICIFAAAYTLKFTGTESMSLRYSESVSTQADNLSLRFRTVEQAGILVVTRHDRSQDKLEIVLEGGRVKVSIDIGLAEKSFYVGQSLNDDMYHTLIYQRRGMKINAVVDDDAPVLGKLCTLIQKCQFFI